VNTSDTGGKLGVQTQDGQKDIAGLYTSTSGAGLLKLYNNSENLLVRAGRVTSGGGYLQAYNDSEPSTAVAKLRSTDEGNGELELLDSNEIPAVQAGVRPSSVSHGGYVQVLNASGVTVGALRNVNNNGRFLLWNEDTDISVSAGTINGGGGYFQVYDNSGVAKGGIRHDGAAGVELWGTTKNFVENHPTQAGKAIVYTCVEGPEAAMYTRGTATLVDGEAKVLLPEHFSMMASYNGKMTVTLTPHSAESEGLARIELNPERLVVQELRNGTGTYEFDYEIKAIRYNREDHQVVQSWTKWAGPDAKNNSNPRGWRPRYK
jgi:hypothetical protein